MEENYLLFFLQAADEMKSSRKKMAMRANATMRRMYHGLRLISAPKKVSPDCAAWFTARMENILIIIYENQWKGYDDRVISCNWCFMHRHDNEKLSSNSFDKFHRNCSRKCLRLYY